MTALAKDVMRFKATVDQRLQAVPIAADVYVKAGGMACADADGNAVPAANTPGLRFLGLVWRGFDNTGGAAGTIGIGGALSQRVVEVDKAAIGSYVVQGSPKADATVYVVDDDTLTTVPTTAGIIAGKCLQPDNARSGRWLVDHAARPMGGPGSGQLVALSLRIPDANTAGSHFIPLPVAGHIVALSAAPQASNGTADTVLTAEIGGVAVTHPAWAIADDAIAGDVSQVVPTAAHQIDAGEAVEIVTDGGGSTAMPVEITVLLRI